MTRRRNLTVVLVTVFAVLAAGFVAVSAIRARAGGSGASGEVGSLTAARHIVFRSLADGPSYKQLAVASAADPARRAAAGPRCERTAAARRLAVCLNQTNNPLHPFGATLLDAALKPRSGAPTAINGIPSRARVSEDGRYFATTTFVSGHSYLSAGFSTETVIYTADGNSVGNVEDFAFVLNGQRNNSIDRNVWGITFVSGTPRFYATVGTQGRTYLVEGDLDAKTLTGLRVNAECPSLSPDGRHIVYKKRVSETQNDAWRFHVLNTETGEESMLGEQRSIDDQVAWLDNTHILYGVPKDGRGGPRADVWVAAIDGSAPRLLISDADSPTVVGAA